MRNKVLQAQLDKMPFMLHPGAMSALLEMANSETPRAEDSAVKVANNSVAYQTFSNVAVISVDGGLYKKGVNGFCSSIASYQQINDYRNKAENDSAIDTVVYRVDTPGGAVAGVEETEDLIFTSKKKTVTLYENQGASAGIFAFMASDEVYATETTMLGSIGVVVSYMQEDEDSKRIEIVSKNAQNKRCSLNGDCQEKIQSMIDGYEELFYARVQKNTGFSEEKIKTVFDNGGMIFANKAKKEGFIQGVTTFDKLMKTLVKGSYVGSTIVPTASGKTNTKQNTQGEQMKFDRDDLDATEALFNTLVANKSTMENRNQTLKTQLETVSVNLEAKEEEVTQLQASLEKAQSEAEEKVKAYSETVTTRLAEAKEQGVSVAVALDMVNADSEEEATKLALDADKDDAVNYSGGEGEKETSLLAYAQKNKGSIR